jgi:Cu-processing system permease protein
VFVVFGSGLIAGLLGSIGQVLGSGTLKTASQIVSWVLPFEALYRDGLHAITETSTLSGFILRLGPLGSSHAAGPFLGPFVALYIVVVVGLALTGLARRDL